jgi:tRNA(Ile)-lysidine synthase
VESSRSFRKSFSNELITQYRNGIKRSFKYLNEDKKELQKGFETLYKEKQFHIIKLHTTTSKAKAVDLTLKKLGYLLSSHQRKEITNNNSLVIGGLWAVEEKNNLVYISPYSTIKMSKIFKEKCRIGKIPPKIRAYCYKENISYFNYNN